ncbi:unnamed protein product, partial [Ceratitis capitata]
YKLSLHLNGFSGYKATTIDQARYRNKITDLLKPPRCPDMTSPLLVVKGLYQPAKEPYWKILRKMPKNGSIELRIWHTTVFLTSNINSS